MTGVAVFHAIVAPLLAAVLLHTVLNHRRWPRLAPTDPPAAAPPVSVLIPARNEAGRIAGSVRSWTRQRYPDYEVLVYDDESTDDTAARVLAAARHRGRVRVIRGAGLPPGWRGKTHACHRLRAHARGEVLVFADADVRVAPVALAAAATALTALRVDALSAVPAHRASSGAVRLLVGIQNWVPLAFLPVWLPSAARRPLFAAVNGQFLAIRADVYDAVGGFAAVRGALGEDAAFGRRLARRGYRLRLVDGTRVLTCRPYRSVRELWRANARNLLPVFFGSVGLALALSAALAVLYLGPPVALALAVLLGPRDLVGFGLPLLELGLAVGSRALADRRAGYPLRLSALHPIAVLALVGMSLDSLTRWRWRRRVEWRDRCYEVDGVAARASLGARVFSAWRRRR